jgi:hypothetical protein
VDLHASQLEHPKEHEEILLIWEIQCVWNLAEVLLLDVGGGASTVSRLIEWLEVCFPGALIAFWLRADCRLIRFGRIEQFGQGGDASNCAAIASWLLEFNVSIAYARKLRRR